MTTSNQTERILKALDGFSIEIPSWGFANTGTRFGKFVQASAANTTEQKLNDAGQVHHYTGCCPSVATHVLWDFPEGLKSTAQAMAAAKKAGVRLGAINPNVFQDQIYKNGSLGNPDPEIRQAALQHILDSIEIGKLTGSQDVSLWFGDGSSYPGTANIRHRKQWFAEGLRKAHEHLSPQQRLLVEYKPFEPYFYHTDLGDWGMALIQSRAAGPQAKVLVDTGHHYQAQNIEQIVAWLLSEDMLGGFHFNDRRYADDDLTLGSIDPYQVFRILNEVIGYERESGKHADIAYMIDQSHNLKDKIEEMIQTAVTAQELYAKAVLVDHEKLTHYQMKAALIDAEECLKSAFSSDVRPAIREWRHRRGLAEDPLKAFRESGYTELAVRERSSKNLGAVASYA
jgi:L-rhamnose isomerase / sugar isomerase